MEQEKKPLILAVDDNEAIRQLVEMVLSEYGMDVVTASDGDIALEFMKERRPNVLLLDLSMPRVNGTEVLRQVRADPILKDLCVILLTAVANTARFKDVQQHRPDGFLEKPFHIKQLVEIVQKALDNQSG